MEDHIFYAGYGSNLSMQRFLCYIEGGRPDSGKRHHSGCEDRTPPLDGGLLRIRYPLYFALPEGKSETSNWGPGGVAFIGSIEDDSSSTICRIYRITRDQFENVRDQEGRGWYGRELVVGERDGLQVLAITSMTVLSNLLSPSEAYLKTIAAGLLETGGLDSEAVADYLIDRPGVRGGLERDHILRILARRE